MVDPQILSNTGGYQKMNRRIYTKKMAMYLIKKGFKLVDVVEDVNKPWFYNWVFEDSKELQIAMAEFSSQQ